MNISLDKKPGCIAALSAEVPAEKVAQERTKILKTFTREVRLPGFRPGKAPKAVIEKRYGEQINQELERALIDQALREMMKQHEDLKVLEVKAPEAATHEADGSFSFNTEMILAPEIELPDYKGIEIEIPKGGIEDKMIDDQLEQLRSRFADYEDIEGRGLEDGDLAVIDYTSTVDGKPMDEVGGESAKPLAENEGYWIRMEDEAFFPGFTEPLKGMKAGDEKEVTVTLPEDFPIEQLREKEAVFQVKVTGIKDETLPELNDEFAAQLQPGKTMEEIRAMVREDLEGQQKRQLEELKIDRLLEKLHGMVDFELPEEFVKQETQGQADRMVEESLQQGASEEMLEERQAELFETAAARAKTNLKTNFLLQEIAGAEEIKVGQNEILQRVTQMAKQAKTPVKKYIKELQKNGQISNIQNNMLLGKAIDFLLESAKVTEVEQAEETENNE